MKEGKELKPIKPVKEVDERPMSVMSSLSYRKRANIKDSIGGKGDEDSLFSTLKDRSESPDRSFRRVQKDSSGSVLDDTMSVTSWRKSQGSEDLDDRASLVSQAFTEASSRARKGLDKRWSIASPEFDKVSLVSSRLSNRRGLEDEDETKSSLSFGITSPPSLRRSTSKLDEPRNGLSAISPSLSRRSDFGLESPTLSNRSDTRLSMARSTLDDFDDSVSIGFSDSRSLYSQHSSGRSFSVPPQARTPGAEDVELESRDVKPVSHRNYLDPDLEAAINEVLNYKPIKFKRKSLDPDSEDDDDTKSVRSMKSLHTEKGESSSGLKRSASAVDFSRASSRRSRVRKSSSESSSEEDRKKKSSKKHSKKSKKKSKKKQAESSSSSSSSSESDSSSDSTVSYRSGGSVKKGPKSKGLKDEEEPQEDKKDGKSGKIAKKDDKKRKKQVDSLMMKYLYRPESD